MEQQKKEGSGQAKAGQRRIFEGEDVKEMGRSSVM